MELYQNYKQYKQFKPDYKLWKEERDTREAQRFAYLKNNPVDKKTEELDIKRGKILLHAIDVMDESSQTKAEDMEVTTEAIQGQVLTGVMLLGAIVGAIGLASKPIQKRLTKLIAKHDFVRSLEPFLPGAVGILASLPVFLPLCSWAAKKQVAASRQGRFEAMNKDLVNPAAFAVLDETQLKEVQALSKDMPDEKDKKKGLKNDLLGPIKMIKQLVVKDKEYEKSKKEFNDKIKENEKNIGKPLSEEQVEKAKKDMQLLGKIVEKIDIASQDYAENIELATNSATAIAFGGGFLTKFLVDKVVSLFKVKNNSVAKTVTWLIPLAASVGTSIYSAKLQKQGSRIGRFKAKQEFLNNPESLIYTDDEKVKNIKEFEPIKNKKRPNMFKFLVQAYKDNKEYVKYKKTKGQEEKKFTKAIEKIKLSDKQLQEAKVLQHNTFHTFNKVDEKSQTYAESVEALGESIKTPFALICEIVGIGLATVFMAKKMNKMQSIGKLTEDKIIKTALAPAYAGMAAAIIPSIILDIFITKEQKKASRIADMLALKELNDYRKYADYSIPKSFTQNKESQKPITKSSNLIEMLKLTKN